MTLPIITSGKQPMPPRCFIYGTSGVGKTTLAASIPGAILMPVEEGSDALECSRLPQPTSFDQVLEQLRSLCAEEHPYTTLVIDSVTALEQLIWKHVVASSPKCKSIEEIDGGWGKGYVHAAEFWRFLLEELQYLRAKRGMSILLIGHAEIKNINVPDSESFDRYQPRLHKIALAMLTEWSDALLFANYKTYIVSDGVKGGSERARGVGTGERIIYANERPSHLAKNRYALPDQMPMQWNVIQSSIIAAFTPAVPTQGMVHAAPQHERTA